MCVLQGPEHRFEFVNAAYLQLVGQRDLVGKTAREALPEVQGQGFFKLLDRVYAMGEPYVGRGVEITVEAGPGGAPERRVVDLVVQPVTGADGQVSGIFVEGSDVTEAYRARDALAAGNARYTAVLDAMGEGFLILDDAFRVVEINAEGLRLDGRPRGEVLGRSHWELWPVTLGTPVEHAYRKAMVDRVPVLHEYRYVADGHDLWLELRIYPVPGGVAAFYRNVTERKRAEAALRESEARFRHMADSAPALIWMTDETGGFTFANMHFGHLFGHPTTDFQGDGWKRLLLPDNAERFHSAFMTAFHARRPFRAEVRVRDKEGQVRWLRCEGVARLDDAGRFLGYTGCSVDITEARLAAEELERRVAARTAELSHALGQLHKEVLEREQAEAQLRQAQKMEAVGQLTGGIAHDFNNMLQGVAGSLDLMERRIAQGRAEEAGRYVAASRQTLNRAAGLTHRLLAFARRQTLTPRAVEPDDLVRGMEELIRRTVGPAVRVELSLRDGVWSVLCDANQLENALLNLCINARDAMPECGTLTIGTEDVRLERADVAGQDGAEPGEYVMIAVSDTGTGMTPEVLARAFEPFFTTKPIGQGTGLGLSQLYGFVRQSDGVVRLESKPGQGTTVRLYLPKHEGERMVPEPEEVGATRQDDRAGVATGAGVLVVEDEEDVRALIAEVLRDLGCVVLEAEDGSAGLCVLQSREHVDLLITDVGLPGLNGRQLADAARERRSGLPVLLITGYAGAALDDMQLAPGMEIMTKPFALDKLAARVTAMLERVPVQ